MTPREQIPGIDAAVAQIDRRINRAYITIERLNDEVNRRLKRIERVRRYARELGVKRSKIATFELSL